MAVTFHLQALAGQGLHWRGVVRQLARPHCAATLPPFLGLPDSDSPICPGPFPSPREGLLPDPGRSPRGSLPPAPLRHKLCTRLLLGLSHLGRNQNLDVQHPLAAPQLSRVLPPPSRRSPQPPLWNSGSPNLPTAAANPSYPAKAVGVSGDSPEGWPAAGGPECAHFLTARTCPVLLERCPAGPPADVFCPRAGGARQTPPRQPRRPLNWHLGGRRNQESRG